MHLVILLLSQPGPMIHSPCFSATLRALEAWLQELHQRDPLLSHFGWVWPVGVTDRRVTGDRVQGVSSPVPLHLATKFVTAAASVHDYDPPARPASTVALALTWPW